MAGRHVPSLTCKVCQFQCTDQDAMRQHFANVHPGSPPEYEIDMSSLVVQTPEGPLLVGGLEGIAAIDDAYGAKAIITADEPGVRLVGNAPNSVFLRLHKEVVGKNYQVSQKQRGGRKKQNTVSAATHQKRIELAKAFYQAYRVSGWSKREFAQQTGCSSKSVERAVKYAEAYAKSHGVEDLLALPLPG
jgi:hypothetical protein